MDPFDEALEVVPGPPGYHADFYKAFGKVADASKWVIYAAVGAIGEIIGPWDDVDEAEAWGEICLKDIVWHAQELVRPEDWPGFGLTPPEDDDITLFDR